MAEQARFTSAGRLGLNTQSPGSLLHVQGDGYFSGELETAKKIRASTDAIEASINQPIFSSDPVVLEDGDMWVTDSGGVRELKVRISGVTFSTTLT